MVECQHVRCHQCNDKYSTVLSNEAERLQKEVEALNKEIAKKEELLKAVAIMQREACVKQYVLAMAFKMGDEDWVQVIKGTPLVTELDP